MDDYEPHSFASPQEAQAFDNRMHARCGDNLYLMPFYAAEAARDAREDAIDIAVYRQSIGPKTPTDTSGRTLRPGPKL